MCRSLECYSREGGERWRVSFDRENQKNSASGSFLVSYGLKFQSGQWEERDTRESVCSVLDGCEAWGHSTSDVGFGPPNESLRSFHDGGAFSVRTSDWDGVVHSDLRFSAGREGKEEHRREVCRGSRRHWCHRRVEPILSFPRCPVFRDVTYREYSVICVYRLRQKWHWCAWTWRPGLGCPVFVPLTCVKGCQGSSLESNDVMCVVGFVSCSRITIQMVSEEVGPVPGGPVWTTTSHERRRVSRLRWHWTRREVRGVDFVDPRVDGGHPCPLPRYSSI